ncbi:MAG: VWA domain-containing protein, partial [Acidobacteriota bacterium]
QDPWVLLFALLLPLLAIRRHRHRAYGQLTYSSLPLAASGAWRLHLPFYLRLAALALLILAAARPQLGSVLEEQLTEGIDIQVVLDISGSMAAEDFQPRNRLTVAKEVMKEFVTKRLADRIGIVVFAGRAVTKAPLTGDHAVLQHLLESIELHTLPDGTAIGMALAAGAARLRDSTAKTRVVVLVTDGVNNSGTIDPDSAAAVCEGLGIKVYTIGVGTAGVVPVPMQFRDAFGRLETRRVEMNVEVDEELLQAIAERTGGRFYQAHDPAGLRSIFAEIDELEKTPLEIKRYTRYREAFQPLMQAALTLLLAPLLLALFGLTVEP